MQILKEGTISINPDGSVMVVGFQCADGTVDDLRAVVESRIRLAAHRINQEPPGMAQLPDLPPLLEGVTES